MRQRTTTLPTALAARHRPHREDAHDDGHGRVLAQLHADVAVAHQRGRNSASRARQADEHLAVAARRPSNLVELAVQLEAPAQLVQRHVRPRLDEAPQLRGGRALLALAGVGVRVRAVCRRASSIVMSAIPRDFDHSPDPRVSRGRRAGRASTWLSTSAPSAAHTTMSSMRAPYRPST